jgi:uncharacterized membrane protein
MGEVIKVLDWLLENLVQICTVVLELFGIILVKLPGNVKTVKISEIHKKSAEEAGDDHRRYSLHRCKRP